MSVIGSRRSRTAALCVALAVPAPWAAAQQVIVPFVTGSAIDNRVRVGGTEIERVSGSLWGLGAQARFSPWLGARARIGGGTLTGRSPQTEDRGYSVADLTLVLTPEPWIAVNVGPVIRVFESSLVRQRWAEFRIGSEVGTALVDNVLRGSVRLSLAPMVSVTGQPAPDLAIGGGTTIEYLDGRLVAALDYDFDRYDFPPGPSGRRLEQRTSLRARIGWRVR